VNDSRVGKFGHVVGEEQKKGTKDAPNIKPKAKWKKSQGEG